ncbi:MAG: hypothetical protein HPY66_2948 [Firmicutes bacterium]|nr:hypothetical protein [Bacillota bacterium]
MKLINRSLDKKEVSAYCWKLPYIKNIYHTKGKYNAYSNNTNVADNKHGCYKKDCSGKTKNIPDKIKTISEGGPNSIKSFQSKPLPLSRRLLQAMDFFVCCANLGTIFFIIDFGILYITNSISLKNFLLVIINPNLVDGIHYNDIAGAKLWLAWIGLTFIFMGLGVIMAEVVNKRRELILICFLLVAFIFPLSTFITWPPLFSGGYTIKCIFMIAFEIVVYFIAASFIIYPLMLVCSSVGSRCKHI